ncbi:hypothetical protein C725_0659 [Pacificimonas flava]|uniref:Uncharacterized protein n=1 Tax=Pacificimonas flava TaxID=1234595 RepID=M2U6N3_9SPHN|nr:hypothetical protein C725_0659 [Pacificimonas flava]
MKLGWGCGRQVGRERPRPLQQRPRAQSQSCPAADTRDLSSGRGTVW